MVSVRVNLALSDLPYFDKFLHQEIMKPPVNSLRANGQYHDDLKVYERNYEITIQKGERKVGFQIKLSAKADNISPLEISTESPSAKLEFSEKELQDYLDMLTFRIKEAEKGAVLKQMSPYEFEARLSSSVYPLLSTVRFGKYKIVPSRKRDAQGWEFKLKFVVEEIDKDFALTNAIIEAKEMAAWLSLIFNVVVSFKGFSEITPDPKPKTNYEEIKRPDLRPVKHSFSEELKIPNDFSKLWDNFESLPPEIKQAFISSCLCYQLAMEMRYTYTALSYQLFVTTVEVTAKKAVGFTGTQQRFVEFICRSLNKFDRNFKKKLKDFYSGRSAIVHEKGVGLRFTPTFDLRSFELISHRELWDLEITVNAALISYLEKPFEMVIERKDLLDKNP